MSEHSATPLPWHYTKAYGRNNPDWYIGKGESTNPNGTPLIATVVQYEANAAYIVRACNALPALTNAVRHALEVLSLYDEEAIIRDELRDALAQAGER